MNRRKLLNLILLSATLAACGGGGGGGASGSSSTTQVGNFTQLTPSGGVTVPGGQQSTKSIGIDGDTTTYPPYNFYSAASISTQGNLYLGTGAGCIYEITNLTNGFSSLPTPIVSCNTYSPATANPVLTVAANQNSYDYVLSNSPFSSLGTGTQITTDATSIANAITALTLTSNGDVFFGTLGGTLYLQAHNSGTAQPYTSPTTCTTTYCPISAIGITSNNASSGKKSVVALQFPSESIPVVNLIQIGQNDWPGFSFRSSIACLEQSGNTGYWTTDSLNGIPANVPMTFTYESPVMVNNQPVESSFTITVNMPQYITSMSADPQSGKVYVGTNLFNVFQNSAPCNSAWNQVNTQPLGTVQNGSVGISSVALAGGVFVVSNTNPSTVMAYQQSN